MQTKKKREINYMKNYVLTKNYKTIEKGIVHNYYTLVDEFLSHRDK